MKATQRPEYVLKQQQQQQQHKSNSLPLTQNYFYVTYLGEIRGRFDDEREAWKWANAFGKREANVVVSSKEYKKPVIMPVNKCNVKEDMDLSDYIPFVGERYYLWKEYITGWKAGYQERAEKCPYACPQRRAAWKAGFWNGGVVAVLEE